MKKLVLFTPRFLPHLGGVEKHVSAISQVLHARGWQIEIVTTQENEDAKLQQSMSDYLVKRIPLSFQKTKSGIWKWIKNYFRTVDSRTIIHIHDVGWWLLPVLLTPHKNNFYITFHGWEGQYPIRWQAKLHRWLVSKLMKGSIHVGSFIQKHYWDKPKFVVYGGVDLPIKTHILPISSPINIVFLGRLEKENNIDLYLEVLAKLVQDAISIAVVWVGDGKYRSLCEKWGKVTGMVTDTRKLVKDAHLVFANSYLSILESQAQGKVVCSVYQHRLKEDYLKDYPGSPELLLANSPEAMAQEIKRLIDNPDEFLFRSKKSAQFAQTQTWNNVADVYEELWENDAST